MEGAYLQLSIAQAFGLRKSNLEDEIRVICKATFESQERETDEVKGEVSPEWHARMKL